MASNMHAPPPLGSTNTCNEPGDLANSYSPTKSHHDQIKIWGRGLFAKFLLPPPPPLKPPHGVGFQPVNHYLGRIVNIHRAYT